MMHMIYYENTIIFRFKELLQANLSDIVSFDITLENLLAEYRYSKGYYNDAILLKALKVRYILYVTYTAYDTLRQRFTVKTIVSCRV